MFGGTAKEKSAEPDIKVLHAKIGQLTLEKDFLEGALNKAGLLSRLLKREGLAVGRRRVSTLMKLMNIHALYRKPNTSRLHVKHPVYPYSAADIEHHAIESHLGGGYHAYPDTERLCQSVCRD